MSSAISSHTLRGGASTLAYNPKNNRLIAAGQQNFQLFSIDQVDQLEQFQELHDFRSTPLRSQISRWSVLQPKDVVWNLNHENCFATTSGTDGSLFIWDVSRLGILKQINLHQGIINRISFHPKYPNVLLTASQDGYAKLIDIRINDQDKLISVFRHSSTVAFRDIDINPLMTEKFAAVIHDQYSVPIWDIRQPNQIDFSISTRDKVLSIAWNPSEHSWLATGGIGGYDRTIRVWDTKGNDSRQEALFTVYTYGQVPKLSWHPGEKYQIACFTRTTDFRIHVWDVRRAYLPQISFCHHRNEIEDFLWRSPTDSIISIGRDERLIHAPLSSAIPSENIVSFFSLNVTSKGSVHVTMPNLDNEYIQSLCINRHPSTLSTSLKDFYCSQTLRTYSQWAKPIRGKSLLGIFSHCFHDLSVEHFHHLAKRWKFGNGEKSLEGLARICDENSRSAEELNRYDLSNTWQVIKMLYANGNHYLHSTKSSRSLTKSRYLSDPRRKLTLSTEKQTAQFEQEINGDLFEEQRAKSNSRLEMVDDTDAYIIRESFPDDLIFLTADDLFQNPQYEETSVASHALSQSLIENQRTHIIYTEDDVELESENEYENLNHTMQTSFHSTIAESSEEFFTIAENYCPGTPSSRLNFDKILRETLFYYVENNALQVAVHLLLVLYPQLSPSKRTELFGGAHLQWIVMYIELLQKMRLFVKAKQVTKHCLEQEDVPLNYNSQDYDGTMIFQAHAPISQRLPAGLSPVASSNSRHFPPVLKEFICTICRLPCRGLFTFCGVCFHGGHLEHVRTWFRTHDECPYGCGHRCKDRDGQNHRNSMTQRLISKSSIVFP